MLFSCCVVPRNYESSVYWYFGSFGRSLYQRIRFFVIQMSIWQTFNPVGDVEGPDSRSGLVKVSSQGHASELHARRKRDYAALLGKAAYAAAGLLIVQAIDLVTFAHAIDDPNAHILAGFGDFYGLVVQFHRCDRLLKSGGMPNNEHSVPNCYL
jgi:hypothetical protein